MHDLIAIIFYFQHSGVNVTIEKKKKKSLLRTYISNNVQVYTLMCVGGGRQNGLK